MRGGWLLFFFLAVGCGARTPLDDFEDRDGGGTTRRDTGPVRRDSGPPPTDACVIDRGAPIAVPGAVLSSPTLGRGLGGTMLAFTAQAGLGAQAQAVPVSARGEPLGEIRTASSSRAGTVAGLLGAPLFGLTLKSPDGEVHGATLDATATAVEAMGPFGRTGQERPALAIDNGIIAFGWSETVATTFLFIGDEDTPSSDFMRIVLEGGDLHIAPMATVGAVVRTATVDAAGSARVHRVGRDGVIVDTRGVGIVDGRVQRARAVANATDDGIVVLGIDASGQGVVGAVHDGANHRIERAGRGSPVDLVAAADSLRMVIAASFDDTLEVIGLRGTRQFVTVIDTDVATHPAILAPERTGDPFLLVWEEGRGLAVASVTCP